MILDAVDAGKHVYVEKPMTHTIPQAQEVVRKVHESKAKVQVGVQGMSDESYEVANHYIQQGILGKVVMAQIDYSRNYVDDFWAYDLDPDAKPGVNLDWNTWLGPAPKRPWEPRRYFQWRRYWDYSGGIATDLFIHRVTRIIKSVGLSFPDRVVGSVGTWNFTDSVAEIPDTFNMLCDYPGGPTVVLVSSMANDTAIEHVIRGHKATLQFNRDGFVITPQEISDGLISQTKEQRRNSACSFTKDRRRGCQASSPEPTCCHPQGDALKCDVEPGYYGVVVTLMGVESSGPIYLKWNREKRESRRHEQVI
jgi:predicted dehydrogenase